MASIPAEDVAALSSGTPHYDSVPGGPVLRASEEIDIIRLIQERDAYKLETEKLRKIIDRQRFIIKSLQDQIARKQSISTIGTPPVRTSDVSPEPSEHPELSGSADDPLSATAANATPEINDKGKGNSADPTSNSLGLSSLSNAPQPRSDPAMRKISQGSAFASPPLLPDSRDSVEMSSSHTNMRPWAKSTRLSEIYADYSARHNSVAPMFKSDSAAWAMPGEEGKHQRASSASGSSFVESLKSSIQKTEWPTEWAPNPEYGYSSDRSSGKRISSLILESSREPSVSIEIEGTGGLRSNAQNSQPDHTWLAGLSAGTSEMSPTPGGRMPANEAANYAPPIVQQHSELATLEPVGDGVHTADGSTGAQNGRGRLGVSALAVPLMESAGQATSPATQTAQELLVLRPISILADRNELVQLERTKYDSNARSSEANSRRSNPQLTQYEYSGPADFPPSHVRTDSLRPQQQIQLQQQTMQRQQQQNMQMHRNIHATSSSFGPTSGFTSTSTSSPEHKVKWAMDMSLVPRDGMTNAGIPATAHNDIPLAANGPQATSSLGAQGIRKMASANMLNENMTMRPLSNNEDSVYYEPSVVSAPHSLTPAHSFSSTEKHQQPMPPPLASLQDIDIRIKDSRIKIDERGKEINVYMIDIVRRKEISGMSLQEILIESQQSSIVLWTVEKRYSDFLNLNAKLRQIINKEKLVDKLERLPDKDIFRPNAPTKSDKRKLWFEKYLKKALMLSITDKQPLIEFLSTDRVMEPEKKMPILLGHKEGFLVKKGKNFGGWKRRYYVCKSNKPVLEYFDSPGGSVIGSVNLAGAVVKMGKIRGDDMPILRGKGNQKEAEMFRHAFLIEEKPRREGKEPIAHPLWADSDRERDEWVMALRYVIVLDSDGPERAMRDVTKYLNYTSNKDSNMLMLHQIHTSITHEQGARRSIEYTRRKEEQRNAVAVASPSSSPSAPATVAAGAPPTNPDSPGTRQPANAQNPQAAVNKFGSPLSRQVWPVAASMDNLGHSNGTNMAMKFAQRMDLTNSNNNSNQQQFQDAPREKTRPRSLSVPHSPVTETEPPVNQRIDTDVPSRPSPAVIAATLSTSFSGFNNDSLSGQAERLSVHYVPSEISTIESSIYSSYNGAEGSGQNNGTSSRSVDDRNSYASLPESPVSPRGATDPAARPTENLSTSGSGVNGVVRQPHAAANGPQYLAHADSTPQLQTQVPYTSSATHTFGDTASQMMQAMPGMTRSQFTKNSVGRIVHEEEDVPDLPLDTPRVTDDILGIGRQDSSSLNEVREGSNGRTRTREEKKRGRITFMWGKKKAADNEPALPDLTSIGSNSSLSGKGNSNNGLDTPPPVSAPRRLRRGSTSNDTRFAQGKNLAIKGPVFGIPLERAVELTKVREHYHLPAVVYRSIEYLDAKKAWLEEGIYRQSGGSSALSLLRKEFNSNRDYNLLKLSRPPDIHAVASLLKAYLRELPESVLTLRLHQDFVRVVDLADRGDRVHELGRLVSELPIANYTLLRALTAHLIRIVQMASTNKMTLRNIGIVFSPSLGIPVGVFSLLMVEFEYIFWVNDSGAPEPRALSVDANNTASSGNMAPPKHQFDSHLSVSVPSGLNRMPDDDTLYSAESYPGTDTISFASDAPAHPSRALSERKSATCLRPVANARADSGGVRTQDSNAYGATAVSNAAWCPQLDDDFIDSPGSTGVSDLSRYPGIQSSAQTKPYEQQQHRVGRSNRNSIQYKVGAPRELISQEAEISMPTTINESDDDDDDDE
ncbi:Rho GTPase activating protein [Coemansia spiralis]|uniref:Rho GTPase activating protein n=1 Tax=Coemansia spiralis TaxID=417178 RepID=A0A9W8KYI2_9FUNG|nr:Rho GTPase activating protein [Coemansia spiralis]